MLHGRPKTEHTHVFQPGIIASDSCHVNTHFWRINETRIEKALHHIPAREYTSSTESQNKALQSTTFSKWRHSGSPDTVKKTFCRPGLDLWTCSWRREKTGILLMLLPKSLSFFTVIVQTKNMTYMELYTLLKSEDERRKSAKPVADTLPPPQPAACISNGSGQRSADKPDRQKVNCWYCGKLGDVQAECPLQRWQEKDRTFKAGRRVRSRHQQHQYLNVDNINNQNGQGFRGRHYEYNQIPDQYGK